MNRVRGTLGTLQHGAFSEHRICHELAEEGTHFVASVAVFAVVGAHLVDNYSRTVNADAAFLLKAHDGAQGSFGARHGEKGRLCDRKDALAHRPAHRRQGSEERRAVNQDDVVGVRCRLHHALEAADERRGFLTVHEGGARRASRHLHATGGHGVVSQQGGFADERIPGGATGFLRKGALIGTGNQGGDVGDGFIHCQAGAGVAVGVEVNNECGESAV